MMFNGPIHFHIDNFQKAEYFLVDDHKMFGKWVWEDRHGHCTMWLLLQFSEHTDAHTILNKQVASLYMS